jgi:hypothetical protein
MTIIRPVKTKKTSEAMVTIPLSALRCLLQYPKEGKILCEINTDSLKRANTADTVDEIINEARLDYALGDFTSHNSAGSLISELHS